MNNSFFKFLEASLLIDQLNLLPIFSKCKKIITIGKMFKEVNLILLSTFFLQ